MERSYLVTDAEGRKWYVKGDRLVVGEEYVLITSGNRTVAAFMQPLAAVEQGNPADGQVLH